METLDAELAARARALHEQAHALIDRVGLGDLLTARFGDYSLVGSAGMDLMTRPDIDVYVPVERDEPRRFLDLLLPLHAAFAQAGMTVFRATFNDEWTLPRGDYGSGYYWGLKWRSLDGATWKLDLWGWDADTYARKVREHRELALGLAGAGRATVLRLKAQAAGLSGTGEPVTSWDVYRFLLDGGGGTLDQLREFCRARQGAADPA